MIVIALESCARASLAMGLISFLTRRESSAICILRSIGRSVKGLIRLTATIGTRIAWSLERIGRRRITKGLRLGSKGHGKLRKLFHWGSDLTCTDEIFRDEEHGHYGGARVLSKRTSSFALESRLGTSVCRCHEVWEISFRVGRLGFLFLANV